MYYIGIDLGGTNIAAGIVNDDFTILKKASTPTMATREPSAILDDMAKLCYDLLDEAGLKVEDIESVSYTHLLVGMEDPIRDEVPDALQKCRSAGILTVMITGDHLDTAAAIAGKLGVITDRAQAITGAELDRLDDEALSERITNLRVYARVKPEHKTRIVNAWRRAGYVTAMTGDGVNDAPSLKSADIGIGMGVSGTDVVKNCLLYTSRCV